MRLPQIGDFVHYLQHCEEDSKPQAALVVDITETGVATLRVFFSNGGDMVVRSCHHISSKFLRGDNGDITPGAYKTGAWRLKAVLGDLDGLGDDEEEVNRTQAPEPVAKKGLTPQEKRVKAMEYVKSGMSLEEVCKKVRFLGIRRDEVKVMFEKEGRLPDASLMAAVSGAVN